MKKSEYVIHFSGIKEETETFEYSLGDSFFRDFKSIEWEGGRIGAVVRVGRRPDGLTLDFELNGELTVICDRCLESFPYPVNTCQRLFVKYGSQFEELTEDVVVVAKEDNQLELSGFLYEYLVLALPVKRVHPDDTSGKSGCNETMIKRLEQHLVTEKTEKTDPRWDDLKKLMDKN
ncbi:MAG: DUF177 domain-containing protein [Bacteroidales bacterium]